jgi:hypothetical protein
VREVTREGEQRRSSRKVSSQSPSLGFPLVMHRALFGVFTEAPTAGDQPETGAGSAPAGGENAGGEGVLRFSRSW